MINISDELNEKLKTCRSDVESCRMLADNGIDVEEYQKALPDEVLKKINAGYEDMIGDTVFCPWCKETASDKISYQTLISLRYNNDTYRCRKRGKFFEKGDFDGTDVEMVRIADDAD